MVTVVVTVETTGGAAPAKMSYNLGEILNHLLNEVRGSLNLRLHYYQVGSWTSQAPTQTQSMAWHSHSQNTSPSTNLAVRVTGPVYCVHPPNYGSAAVTY